jgi:hypothetical protein
MIKPLWGCGSFNLNLGCQKATKNLAANAYTAYI